MSLRNLILGFLIRFVLVFGLLILPWPEWNELYGQGFRAIGNGIFAQDGKKWVLYFEAHRQTQGFSALDTRITIGNRSLIDNNGKGPATILGLDTRSIGWIPTALVIALIVATPIPLRRRILALLCGLLLIHAFILLSVAAYIWNESTNVFLVALSPFWKQIADAFQYTLVTQMGISFTMPVLIWILVTFQEYDRKHLLRWMISLPAISPIYDLGVSRGCSHTRSMDAPKHKLDRR